jgi:insulysin
VDAEHIAKITKEEISAFYAHYISTSSSQRAKISVHLQAQSKPAETSLDDKKKAAMTAMGVILSQHKITASTEALQSPIDAATSPSEIPPAISTFLSDVLKLDAPLAAKLLDESKAALGLADAGLPAEPQVLDDKKTSYAESAAGAAQPVLIKDVHAWRASMQVSAGVRPVRSLDEFVDVSEKL